jgi:hypothetical protein
MEEKGKHFKHNGKSWPVWYLPECLFIRSSHTFEKERVELQIHDLCLGSSAPGSLAITRLICDQVPCVLLHQHWVPCQMNVSLKSLSTFLPHGSLLSFLKQTYKRIKQAQITHFLTNPVPINNSFSSTKSHIWERKKSQQQKEDWRTEQWNMKKNTFCLCTKPKESLLQLQEPLLTDVTWAATFKNRLF